MHACLEFCCLGFFSFLRIFGRINVDPIYFNTNRLSANLHVRVRLDSIKERTNKKNLILSTWNHVSAWAMCIYSLKKPKFTLDLRLSSYLCTALQASRNCRKSFIIKPQAVSSSRTKGGKGHQQLPRQAETSDYILPH